MFKLKKILILLVVPSVFSLSSCKNNELSENMKSLNLIFQTAKQNYANHSSIVISKDSTDDDIKNNFIDLYGKLSDEERTYQIIYDLFYPWSFNLLGKNIFDLINNGTIKADLNISYVSLSINQERKMIASFLGYLKIIFVNKFDQYIQNDKILITYKINNLFLKPCIYTYSLNTNDITIYLEYSYDNLLSNNRVIGLIDIKAGGVEMPLEVIASQNIFSTIDLAQYPCNFKSFIYKKAA